MSNLEIDLLRKLRSAADRLRNAMCEFPDYPGAWEDPLTALDNSIDALERYFPGKNECSLCFDSGFVLDTNPIGSVAKASACPRGCKYTGGR